MSDYNKLRDIVIGLQIFMKYGGKHADARHEELWAGPAGGATLSKEEFSELEKAGWYYDAEDDSWRIYT